MAISPHNSKAIKELIAAGIIPPECIRFELLAEAGETVRLRYEVHASEDQIQQIADALKRNPEETREMARSIVLKGPRSQVEIS
jgi:hypothetical protein